MREDKSRQKGDKSRARKRRQEETRGARGDKRRKGKT